MTLQVVVCSALLEVSVNPYAVYGCCRLFSKMFKPNTAILDYLQIVQAHFVHQLFQDECSKDHSFDYVSHPSHLEIRRLAA
jgi:hypothetical protein